MLVLSRKESESILIGDNIRITIVGRSGGAIRIGVDAPRDVPVMRAELLDSPAKPKTEPESAVSEVDGSERRMSPPKWLGNSPGSELLMPSS